MDRPGDADPTPEWAFELCEGAAHWTDIDVDHSGVDGEPYGEHQTVAVTTTAWASAGWSISLTPITTQTSRAETRTEWSFGIPIATGIAGRKRDGLVLPVQLDSWPIDLVRSKIEQDANFLLRKHGLRRPESNVVPSTLLTAIRCQVGKLLQRGSGDSVVRYRIGGHLIASGDALMVSEFEPYGPYFRPPGGGAVRRLPPARRVIAQGAWVVVSSDVWLELMQAVGDLAAELKRPFHPAVVMVPLLPTTPPKNELVVDIGTAQPGLPNGGHCRFNLIRTRSIERVSRHLGHLDKRYLDEIATGLELVLGLE